MSYIFLSHSSKDKAISRFIADELISAGFDVWVDIDSIRSGDLWVRSIETAVRECDAFIVVLSKASRASEWCERETLLAMELGKPVQVALIEDMPLPLHLINRQYTDFRTDKDLAVRQLAAALRRNLAELEAARETDEVEAVDQPEVLSPEPTENNFFQYIQQLPGEEHNALIARDLYHWAQQTADVVEFGGKVTPGFHVRVDVGEGELVTVLSVWAYPKQPSVQVQFQYMASYPPYDQETMRRSTLQSLDNLFNLYDEDFVPEQADRRPTISFSEALDTADKLERFKKIIEEIIDNLRSAM